ERFAEQIQEELNVKQVTLHDPAAGPLLQYDIKANLKTLGPKLGGQLKAAQAVLAAMDSATVAARVQAGKQVELTLPDGPVMLDPADLWVQTKAAEGWS